MSPRTTVISIQKKTHYGRFKPVPDMAIFSLYIRGTHAVSLSTKGISLSQKPYPPMGVPNAYTQFVLFRSYSTPQHPEPAQSTSKQRIVFTKHSIQVGRINLEHSQATASKHWSLHNVRVRVRVRVGWYLLT